MRIELHYLECAVFLCVPGEHGKPRPVGTAFVVKVPDEGDPASSFNYLVTARHCITDAKSSEITVRINRDRRLLDLGGSVPKSFMKSWVGYTDISTRKTDWWQHIDPTADVAAIPMPEAKQEEWPLDYWPVPVGAFIDRDYFLHAHNHREIFGAEIADVSRQIGGFRAAPGDDVFFTGLFVKSYGDKRNLPIARFGSICRMPDDELFPVGTESGQRLLRIQGYLAECRSWGGHSGSPAFWRPFFNPPVNILNAQGQPDTAVKKVGFFNALLGLVSGHFSTTGRVIDLGDPQGRRRSTKDLWTKTNAGIAVITPAEAIRELLMKDDRVMQDRRKRSAERARRNLRDNAAVFDDAGPEPATQITRAGIPIPIPARGAFVSDLTKATRKRKQKPKRKPSRRGKR